METLTDAKFRFANFELDCARRVLTRDREPIDLTPKAFDLLRHLVENHGKLITKSELMELVWPEQFVEENNLAVHISSLRKALGGKSAARFIATVPGKGYTFVADVIETTNESELIIEEHRVSRVVIDEHRSIAASETTEEAFLKHANTGNKRKRFAGFRVAVLSSAAVALAIAGLGFAYWQSGADATILEYKLTKLTTGGDVTSATITPDGNYAVYAKKEPGGESLWLRHIKTGSQQQILATRPVRIVGLAVSPEGNSIYATTFSPRLADPQIWRLPMLGSVVEEINGITTGAAVSFSPDGTRMAFTESRSSLKETQLLTADPDGSNKKVLSRAPDERRSFPNFNASPVSWSPDGKTIACAVGEENNGTKHGILLIDPLSGAERFISERRWDFIDHLAWIDADNLAFVGYTLDPWLGQIWSISKTTGEARKITNDLTNYSWLASTGGSLLAVQENAFSRIAVSDFDDKLSAVVPRETLKESGFISNVSFAADGSILYSSNASGRREIWRANADGTDPKQLTVNANVTFGMSVSPVDGSIVFCSSENGVHRLKLIEDDGTNVRSLTEGPDDVNPHFAADGGSVIFQSGLYNKLVTLWRVSLADGSRTQLTQTFAAKPSVSPDGSQIAYYFMDSRIDGLWKIGLASGVDGSYLGKLNFPRSVTERRMRWHPDGRSIGQIFNDGEKINLLILPTNGGESRTLSGLGTGEAEWFEWSRDGKSFVIATSVRVQDVVLLSN